MMDRSKAGRVARHARNRNWRSILVFAGAIGYWGSVAGQLVWGLLGALDAGDAGLQDQDYLLSQSWVSYAWQILQECQISRHCSADFAPYAGLSLVVGILSLWWNPKLRLKVEGRGGRFAGLGEYYQVQLIVIVVRCVFWAVLKDPSSSGLQPTMPPALHLFMFLFTVLVSNLFSQNSLNMLIWTSLLLSLVESFNMTLALWCHGLKLHQQRVLHANPNHLPCSPAVLTNNNLRFPPRDLDRHPSGSRLRNWLFLDPPPEKRQLFLLLLQRLMTWIGLHLYSMKFDQRTVFMKGIRNRLWMDPCPSMDRCLPPQNLRRGIFGASLRSPSPLNRLSSPTHSIGAHLKIPVRGHVTRVQMMLFSRPRSSSQ